MTNFDAENRAADTLLQSAAVNKEKISQNVELKDLKDNSITSWLTKNGNPIELC